MGELGDVAGIDSSRSAGDSGDPMSLFYALPVALLAMTAGAAGFTTSSSWSWIRSTASA